MPSFESLPAAAASTSSRYQLIGRIGHGGMAEALLAMMDAGWGARRLVVLKRLWPELASDPDFMTMFMDEARLSVRLDHPNLERTFEVISNQTGVAISKEYLDGQPLTHVLTRLRGSDELSIAQRVRIVSDVLAGLEHAHQLSDLEGRPLNVVHRDVNPRNVFLTYDGQVKLVDFGAAKTLASSHRTRPGALKGKLAYMAPEQLQPGPIDRRADLFAAGVMLWELLTGRRIWQGMSEIQIVTHLSQGLPLPSLPANPSFPPGLYGICERALDPEPARRYQTAAEMECDLARITIPAHDSQARQIGNIVARAFALERADRQELIESSALEATSPDALSAIELRADEQDSTPYVDVIISESRIAARAISEAPVPAPTPRIRFRRVAATILAGAGIFFLVQAESARPQVRPRAIPAPVANSYEPRSIPAQPAQAAPPSVPASAPDRKSLQARVRPRRHHARSPTDEDATLLPTIGFDIPSPEDPPFEPIGDPDLSAATSP